MIVTMAMTKTVNDCDNVTSTMTMIVTLRTIRSRGFGCGVAALSVGGMASAGGRPSIHFRQQSPNTISASCQCTPSLGVSSVGSRLPRTCLDMHRGTRSPSCARFCRTRLAHGLGGDSEARIGCTASGCTRSGLRQGGNNRPLDFRRKVDLCKR